MWMQTRTESEPWEVIMKIDTWRSGWIEALSPVSGVGWVRERRISIPPGTSDVEALLEAEDAVGYAEDVRIRLDIDGEMIHRP